MDEHICPLCDAITRVPPGTDRSSVRCPNVDAMWHAVLMETYKRTSDVTAHISQILEQLRTKQTYIETSRTGLERSMEGLKEEAKRVAELLG